jgi:hypothetical protein
VAQDLSSKEGVSMLQEEQTLKFQKIYKEYFGKEISFEEAQEKGSKLLRMFQLIWRPMSEDDFARLQKRRAETDDL